MANSAREDYIFFLREPVNGTGGPVGIGDSTGGQYTNEGKNNQGQKPGFPSLHQKEEEHCTKGECQNIDDYRLGR